MKVYQNTGGTPDKWSLISCDCDSTPLKIKFVLADGKGIVVEMILIDGDPYLELVGTPGRELLAIGPSPINTIAIGVV